METIVFFGKGGIGKSTIAANVSAVLASGGRKVLHLGCDPKMDSTLSLMGRPIPPFASKSGKPDGQDPRESIFPSAAKGVHCIEAGGPQPGVGCAGTGIGSMLDALRDGAVLERDGYTAAVFDVLGDVVCGGFAAPLRRGFARKAVIVTSEELLSLYAANKLIAMINNYSRNGVYLAGLTANVRDAAGAGLVEGFARRAGTRVLGVILHDPAVAEAERARRVAVLANAKSGFARRVARLGLAIRSAGPPPSPPRSLPDDELTSFAQGHPGRPAPAASRRPGTRPAGSRGRRSAAALFQAAGFSPTGVEGGQILCDWTSSSGVFPVVIAPASQAQEGMPSVSDWAFCFHPSAPARSRGAGTELWAAARRLAPLSFDEMLRTFVGVKDVYGKLSTFSGSKDTSLTASGAPIRPHLGFGQWQRFIFPRGDCDSFVPPGIVMVEHGDAECRFSDCGGGSLGMFSKGDDRRQAGRKERCPSLPKSDPQVVNTDFHSRDSIFGDEEKMLESLRDAARRADPGGLVEFYVGCSPLLLSSDVRAFARRVEKETGVTVLIERFNSYHEPDARRAAARAGHLAKLLGRAKAAPACDVHLVGFHAFARQMIELLASCGMSARASRADFCRGAKAARLQVLLRPNAVLESAFTQAGMKWIRPAPPYGFAGTSAWLAEIATALGRKRPRSGPSPEIRAAADGLRRRARGRVAGFVLAARELPELVERRGSGLAPVLRAAGEAGFELRFFVMTDGSGKTSGDSLPRLKRAVPGARVSLRRFKTPGELHRLLRADPKLRLVYSDIRQDPRLVSAGKNPFSEALLEPGHAGALETWRRLIESSEWDFHERYLAAR